jgi:hypothetical protein
MRLEYALRATAQRRADEIHQWMIDNDAGYAGSVRDGQTLRWSFVTQVDLTWAITVKGRVLGGLSALEKLEIR